MKKLLLLALASCALAFYGCKEDEPVVVADTMTVTAELKGSNEVPANTSAAKGAVTGKYNKTSKILSVSTTYTGLTPTAGHIHNAAAGVNGSVVFPFGTTISPIAYTSAVLTAAQETELLAGRYYVNLHSNTYKDGEIRGQLMVK